MRAVLVYAMQVMRYSLITLPKRITNIYRR